MKKCGAVLVFKPGVSKAEAARRLRTLVDVLDPSYFSHFDFDNRAFVRDAQPPVHEFDSEMGGPVWYIP